ncbi:hypothetical protein [Vibrio vulnificus]|uniref:hypothetical protein n=1 Tax=Vibrio vulnificus TaxID=672 RepID=UPI00324223CE
MGLEVAAIAAIASAVVSVVSFAMTISMNKKNQGKDNGTSIDRKGQDNPKLVAFGRCMVPASRVWTNVNNRNSAALVQAYSFGVGQIKQFEQVYIDGVNYFNGAYPAADKWHGSRSSNEFHNVEMGLRLGKAKESNAYPKLVEHGDGEWVAACRGDRTPSASLYIWRDINKKGDNNVRFISDRVQVEALVHGNAVIDPRFDLSLQGANDWTKRTWENQNKQSYRNPACVTLTYLLDTYYGLGVPANAVDINSFIELANYCDSEGFTFDGYIDQSSDYAKILTDMCSSWDGVLYVEDGLIKAKADRRSPVVADINVDHIVDGFKLSNSNDSSYYNVVSCEFINRETEYTKDKFVLPKNVLTDQTIKNDGFQKEEDFKFLYTSDSNGFPIIKKLANRKLKKARFQQTVEFGLDNTQVQVKLYDVVSITHPDYGLNKKKFRIDKIVTTLDDQTMVSKITATEYNESVYDSSSYEDGVTSPPVKPPSKVILSPVNLKFQQHGFTVSGSGRLSWQSRYNKEHRTVVEYKLSSATSWKRANEVLTSEYEFTGLRPDNYDFRVSTFDFFGSSSEWSYLRNQKVQGGVTLPNVTGLKAVFDSEDLILTWDDMKKSKLPVPSSEHFDGVSTVGDVFSHYEVVINKGASSVYKETLHSASNTLTYTFNQNVITGINRNIEAVVFIVAKDGSKSLTGARVRKINAQTTQPTGLKVEAILSNVSVMWEQPFDKDFYATDIHIMKDAQAVPSVTNLVTTTMNNMYTLTKEYTGVHYIKVGHYDKFGKDGIVYSPAMPFTQKSIDDILDEAPSFIEAEGNIADIKDNVTSIEGDIAAIDKDIAAIDKDITSIEGQVDQAIKDITANAKEITTVNTTLGDHQKQITSNKTLITGLDGNLASYKQTVAAEFNGVKGSITSNQTAIANTNKALTEYKTQVTAEFNGVKGSIDTNKTAIADANKALTEYKTSVAAEFNGVKGSINTNKTAIADANKAITALDTKLSSEIDGVESNINQNYYTKTQADGKVKDAVSALKTELNSTIDGVKSNLSQNYYTKTQTDGKVSSAISTLKTELTSSINGVQGNVDKVNASLSQNYYTKTQTDGKVSSAISTLKTELKSSIDGVQGNVDKVNSNLSQNFYTKTQADEKVSTAVSALETKLNSSINGVQGNVDKVNANLSQNFYTKTQADEKVTSAVSALETTLNSSITGVDGKVNSTNANLSKNYYTKADADKAIAESSNKLSAAVGQKYATISTVNQVKVTADGAASAVSQLTQTVNGKTSGIIMVNDGTVSKTAVISDKFMVCTDATGANKQAVFEVSGGKTIIKSALIGSLDAGSITSGTMSGDRISATSKLFVGSGNTSATLSGADATYRIWSGHATAASAPFRVDKAGKLFCGAATVNGDFTTTGNGKFKGKIEADSGYFKGSLNIQSAATGARMTMTNNRIDVYDASGRLRVRIGQL